MTRCARGGPPGATSADPDAARRSNDVTERERIWRRFAGDDWAAFDALPSAVRRRLREHAYDAWAVNALILWREFRRKAGGSARAERRLLRYLDECEALERAAFADAFARRYGSPLPHVAAGATVLRVEQGTGRATGEGAGPSVTAGRRQRRDDGPGPCATPPAG